MSEIAYVAHYLSGTGGASQSAVDVLIALLLAHRSVTVMSNTGRRCRLPDRIDGQTLPSPRWLTPPKDFPWPPHNFPRQIAGWFASVIQDPGWARRLKGYAPPDLTIVNSFGNDLFLEKLTKINPGLRKKTAMVVRGSPKESTFQASPLTVEGAIKMLRRYDYLIFVSSHVRDAWLVLDTLADKETFYIPNCCQEEQVTPILAQDRVLVRARIGYPANDFVVVCVASVQPRKGQDLLVEYMPDLVTAIPELRLYVVGPLNTTWSKNLRQKVQVSRLANRIHFLGAKSNALDYIYAADALILPSRAEAMPRVILEAMALKTAVVASDVDGIPELIRDGHNGLLFSLDRPEDMIAALRTLAADSALRYRFAEQGYQTYWSNFSRAHQIKRYAEAVQQMIGDI